MTEEKSPPEERFWNRYSPNREFSISGTTSILMHVLVLGACMLGGFALFRLKADAPISVSSVEIEDGPPGGKGPEGPAKEKEKEIATPPSKDPLPMPPLGNLKDPTPVSVDRAKLPDLKNDPTAERFIAEGTRATQNLSDIGKDLRQTLMDGLDGGPGTGDLRNVRKARTLRWFISFQTVNGDDYRKQLAALGVLLAIPDSDGKHGRLIRDLKKTPVSSEQVELKTMNMFFAVDRDPMSVKALARSLGLKHPPKQIVAFFPPQLEKEFLEKEKAHGGLKEEDIVETRFKVSWVGEGKVEFTVEFQR